MQQRQLRLGDILDDYCPRERRLTNHAVVAMVGPDVKQTRCTTCDAEHEYKHAKVPRQRRKSEAPAALYAQVAAGAPKRVVHDPGSETAAGAEAIDLAGAEVDREGTPAEDGATEGLELDANGSGAETAMTASSDNDDAADEADAEDPAEDAGGEVEGPVHRPLIRATLPRTEGQPPPVRPAPDFTIRQPGGRQNRFRRPARGAQQQQFQGGRSNGNAGGHLRGGVPRPGGRPQGGLSARPPKRHGPGGKRSK